MASKMQDHLASIANRLRYQPTTKRVRADAHGVTVADSTSAVLVWQPGSPVPVYGLPARDVDMDRVGDDATRLTDPDLAEFVLLAPTAFTWREEDEEVVGHPRDPYHRVDVVHSARRVTLRFAGAVIADSHRCEMVFETGFPEARYYLPRGDVAAELRPSDTRTVCPYKGEATYWTAVIDGHALENIAWSYEHPLPEAVRIRSLVAFHDERLDPLVV
ncbi:DUF427 domain-containing protein [Rhodococcus sp. NPDC058521]|uniref:DUF427 domain-containing protein n=1 Tax=Rhodococcus sp. NPDC058521 TaxID=3346536 RepID=UPI003658C4AF